MPEAPEYGETYPWEDFRQHEGHNLTTVLGESYHAAKEFCMDHKVYLSGRDARLPVTHDERPAAEVARDAAREQWGQHE